MFTKPAALYSFTRSFIPLFTRSFTRALPASALCAALVSAAGAADFPRTVHYVNHEKAATAFVKGGRIVEDAGLTIIANRGLQRGAEQHAKTNHVFIIIVDGEGEFITGGKLIEPKESAPGEIRAKGIEGGVSHHLAKGDVITVPANTPHWWKDTAKTGSVGYYAVNYLD